MELRLNFDDADLQEKDEDQSSLQPRGQRASTESYAAKRCESKASC